MSTASTIEQLSLRDRVRRFFFAEEVPYGMALVRMLLPAVLLIVVVQRWAVARELFSADGATAQLSIAYGYGKMLPELPGFLAVALFTALAFFLVSSAIGWCTRVSLACSFVLYVYFNLLDATGTITKYSVIASHALLLLSLSNCGAVWSVDAWRTRRRRDGVWPGEPRHEQPRFAVWPQRLLQIMIGVVYFGAAITKMHTPAFFSGDQLLFWTITNVNFANPVGEYFTFLPWALSVFAYVVIVWEVLFLFLGWRGWGRFFMLAFGIAFHLGTTLILGLYVFPAVCISIYFAWTSEDDVRRAFAVVRRWRRRRGWRPAHAASRFANWRNPLPRALRVPAPIGYSLCLLGVAMLGVELEHQIDPYGLRRPEGPHTLKQIPRERVLELLTSDARLREQDKFLAFDIGTVVVGGMLVDRKQKFRYGETLTAQCSYNPPHEDMWVQCDLHAVRKRHEAGAELEEPGELIDEVGQIVTRDMLRSYFTYRLGGPLEPGEYFVVLKSRGKQIARRKFTLLPRKGAVAN